MDAGRHGQGRPGDGAVAVGTLSYLIRRLLLALITLFGITIVTFFIVSAAPGDPAARTVVPLRATVGDMFEGSRAPGGSAASPRRFNSSSPRQLLSQIPVPGAISPEP